MNILNKGIKYLTDGKYRFMVNSMFGCYDSMTDEKYLKKKFFLHIGKPLNLEEPKTYNEKLQWMKLNYYNPDYVRMVDKYEVKEFIANKIGDEYIIPTIGVWDSFDDIDFDMLPNQFVLKCTHDSGGLVIVRDKKRFNKEAAKKKINKSLKRNFFYVGREWPYKEVTPRIICEKYMEDTITKDINDFKFFTFDGKVKLLYIATGRNTSGEEVKFDFFDENGNYLEIQNEHPNAKTPPQLPINFEKMKTLAEKVSEGMPHVRVDFYEIDGEIYFGELTFFHMSGFAPFKPDEWDYKIGSWLSI